MTQILRRPEELQKERFDLIVIGGGIYGVCMLLEASQRGWKSLLIERNDFGGATSASSLRILHGGLRYLQSLDFARFRRSVKEQAWWLTHFPDLVEPLPCVMPLYNRGIHRTQVLACALKLNDLLAGRIRRGTPALRLLGSSRILSADETTEQYRNVKRDGLRGAALWHDVRMKSPQRLLIELLRWSIAAGGEALNYVECTGFQTSNGRIKAVTARCMVSDDEYVLKSDHIVSCVGPWHGDVAALLRDDLPVAGECEKRVEHALAFNLVIDRPPLSDVALAVAADPGKTPTYFVVPFGKKNLVGTYHLAAQVDEQPSQEHIADFLQGLNQTVPGWNLNERDIQEIFLGRLPAATKGSRFPAKSPRIHHIGSFNFTCVEGPKYTTARHIAIAALRQISERRGVPLRPHQQIRRPPLVCRPNLTNFASHSEMAQELQSWIADESIVKSEDILRRQDLSKDDFQRIIGLLPANWPDRSCK